MTKSNTTLLEKLIEVAREVPYISKGGYNEAQDYKYLSEAQVTTGLRDSLLSRGVLFYPQHRLAGDLIVNEKGRIVTTIESEWVFTDGLSEIRVTTIGQGADNGDKGAFKAMTGSKKYALLQALLIATGEDPEESRVDEKEPRVAYATVDQKNQLAADGKAVGLEGDDLRKFVVDTTGKQSSNELTAEDMSKLFAALEVLKATGGQVVTA